MTTVTLWTLVLFAIMLIGVALSWFDVLDARYEHRTLIQARRTSGLNWIVANGNLRTAYFTLGVFISFGMACVVALAVEDPIPRQVVIRIGFTGGGLLLTLKRVFDRFDRRKIHRLQQRVALAVAPGSLLAAAGGRPVLQQIMAELYARLLRDEALKHYFDGMNVNRLIHAQVDLLIRIFNEELSPADLRASHAHLHITSDDFDRFVTIFRETLAEFTRLPSPFVDRLLQIVASTRDLIVTQDGPS